MPVSFDESTQTLLLKCNGGGAAVAKSNTAFVIGTYEVEKKGKKDKDNASYEFFQNAGQTNLAVERLQNFLVTNNL